MNLPRLFTRVGIMAEPVAPTDVSVLNVDDVYGSRDRLIERVATFLRSLDERGMGPRR